MDSVLKNVLISGIAVFFVVGLFAYVQVQKSQAKVQNAEWAAAELGQDDARRQAESGERFLLAAAYGWGPSEIPGVDLQLYRKCLADDIELRIFEEFGDVRAEVGPEDRYRELIENPRSTWIYAESFNKEMLRLMPNAVTTGCRTLESV